MLRRPCQALARLAASRNKSVRRGLPIRRFSAAAHQASKPRGSVPRKVLKAFAAGSAAMGLGTWAAYQTGVLGWLDEGSERSLRFWSAVFPIYIQYESVQQRYKRGWISHVESTAKYEALHDKYSEFIRDLTYEMRGFYLKNAQIMSTRDEFVPAQYLSWCKETQDNCPSEFQGAEARAEAEKQFGRPLEELFERWEEEPMAVASIGQVHAARLRPEVLDALAKAGHPLPSAEVVVKIQTPNIEKRFRADIKTIIAFCKIAMPQHVPPMEEIEKQFLTEFDYCLEAANLQEVRQNVLNATDLHGRPWAERVAIPAPATPLCTPGVLVMERLGGVPLVKGLKAQFSAIAKSRGKTLQQLEADTKEAIESGLQERLSLSDDAAQFKHYNRMLRVQQWLTAPLRGCWNCTVGLLAGQWAIETMGAGPGGELLSLGATLQTLADVHAHEIFVDGCFNGDPHPGNVMLLPDGRLGLIDYGQVKRIELPARLAYARLIVALDEGNQEEVFRISHDDIGHRSKFLNQEMAFRLNAFWNDRDTSDITGGRNISEFLDWAEAVDPIVKCAQDYVMVSRVNVMMRGMANAFNLRLQMAPIWRPAAEALLSEHGESTYAATRAVRAPGVEPGPKSV